MTRLKCKLILVYFEIVLILTQDRCTVCAERPIGSEIVLDAHDYTQKSIWTHLMVILSDVGLVESRFHAFGDSVSVGAR